MFPLLCFASLLSLAFVEHPAIDLSLHLQLQATAVEALEGGPIVLDVTLSYSGQRQFAVAQDRFSNFALGIETPKTWNFRGAIGIEYGQPYAIMTIHPGDQWKKRVFLHEYFDNIGSGPTSLTVSWPLLSPTDHKLLVEPRVVVKIDIPARTTHLMRTMRCKYLMLLKKGNIGADDIEYIARSVLPTRHGEFTPVAWQLVELGNRSPSAKEWVFQSLAFVHSFPDYRAAALGRTTALMCRASTPWETKAEIFELWTRTHVELPMRHSQSLATADDVWTNVLALLLAPKNFQPSWKAALVQQLQDLGSPVPEKEFGELIRQLDDEEFDVREAASERLAAYGERAEAQLERELLINRSVEVRHRIEEKLQQMENELGLCEALAMIGRIKLMKSPESREVLEILSKSNLNSRLKSHALKAYQNAAP
jgi:hypothetical protein